MFIVPIALARNFCYLEFIWPISWLMAAGREFIIMAIAAAMMMATIIPHLKKIRRYPPSVIKRQQLLVTVFVMLIIAYNCSGPLWPLVVRNELETLHTRIEKNSYCKQGTGYTCGPAAAVTALLKLGIKASEGQLAIVSHTNPMLGTPGDFLCQAIEKLYGKQAVHCKWCYLENINQLQQAGLAVVAVKFSFMMDHYITVLGINKKYVTVADPLKGKLEMLIPNFRKIWRHDAVVIWRDNKQQTEN